MNAIRVRRDELLTKVKENRANHRAIFEEALDGYRGQAIAELEAMLAEAKKGKRIRRAVSLIEPVDQTKEYDRIVKILEMSAEDVVELTEEDFAQYVMDDWRWKGQFSQSTMNYLKSRV